MSILSRNKLLLLLTLVLTSLTSLPTDATASNLCPPTQQVQAEKLVVVAPTGARWDYVTNTSYAGTTWLIRFNTWFENNVDPNNKTELMALGNQKFHAAQLLTDPVITTDGGETICRYSDTTEYYVIAKSTLNDNLPHFLKR
jgi:hypothetical protein